MSNIVIYLPNEPLGKQGGMERATHGLAEMLRGAGHRVLLLCREKNRLGETYFPPVPLTFLPPGLSRREEQDYLRKLLWEEKTDVLIDQTEGGITGRWGIFKNRRQMEEDSLKLVAVQHSSQYSSLRYYRLVHKRRGARTFPGKLRNFLFNALALPVKRRRAWRLQKSLFRDLAANYDHIVTLSSGGMEEFRLLAPGTPAEKLAAIPNALAPLEDAPVPQEKEKRVLFVGRLDNSVKGVDRLLRIWARAGKALPDWRLDIVGDGPDAARLKELAQRLQLSNVSFEGFRNPAPYYRRSSILCLASTFEGFGLVLPEAMQHGCVPMAFNSYAAVRDLVIPDRTGILVRPFDEEEYARQLIRLTQDAPLRAAMAQAGPQHAALFSPACVVREWNSLFQR